MAAMDLIICRCCHIESNFQMLNATDPVFNMQYSTMLEETFNIELYNSPHEVSSICEKCKFGLQEAYVFKKQVLLCEDKLKKYFESTGQLDSKIDNIKEDGNLELNIMLEGFNNESDNDINIYETEQNIKKENIDVVDNLKPTVNKDNILNKISKKEKAKKGIKKKKESDAKFTPLISRQNIDESLINTIKTESGFIYSCFKCDEKTFKTRSSVLSHIANYHAGSYNCPKCDRLCSNGNELRVHYRAHFEGCLSCKVCGVIFNTRYSLKEHMREHLDVTSYMCDLCPKVFKYKKSLKIHMFVHTGGKPKHLCDTCGMCFNDRTNLRIHERAVHMKLRPFSCDYCKATYSAKKHLKIHIITKHLDLKEFTCSFCGDKFATRTSWTKHEMSHKKIFKCACDLQFGGKWEYTMHVKKYKCKPNHNAYGNRRNVFKSKSCDICGKIFATKFTWSRHMDQKHNVDRSRNFVCDICNEKFFELSTLNRHKYKRHVPNIIQDKSKCDICHRRYRNFEKHMHSHLETPYACNICGKRFSEVSARNHHMKYVHTGQRFSCNICNKGYKEKGALSRHVGRIHGVINYRNDFDDHMSRYIINKGQYQ